MLETAGGDLHRKAKNSFELIDEASHCEVKLDRNEKVGGTLSLAVSGDLGEEIGGNHSEQASNIYLKAGSNVVLEAGSSLTLKVGGNHITIDAAGITILGTMVKINSSGGSAASGAAVALNALESPLEAGTTEPGRDTRYEGGGRLAQGIAPPALPGKKTSWIEIELVDEIGQPVPGERYEIVGANDEVIAEGHVNDEGWARAEVPEKATYQIKFPNLDAAAWERQA